MTDIRVPWYHGMSQTQIDEAERFEAGSRRFRSAELVQVIKVVTGEGMGTVGSVFREVTRYIDPQTGTVLAVVDPCPGGKAVHRD